MRRSIAVALVLLVGSSAWAQTTPSPRPPSFTGGWTVSRVVSKMDDSEIVTLSLKARAPIRAWPATISTPALHLRCKEGNVEAYLHFGARPAVEAEPDEASLTMRFDKQTAYAASGDVSTDGEAVFLRSPKTFIQEAGRRNTLWVRFVPFNSTPQEMSFALSGLGRALPRLQRACDWDPAAETADAEKWAQSQTAEVMAIINERTTRMLDPGMPEARRITAAYDLGNMGMPQATVAVPALVNATGESQPTSLRVVAANSLGSIRPVTQEAIRALEEASHSATTLVAEAAERNLKKLEAAR